MPRLTSEQRATILDRYLAGESCPVIGASLGCSAVAVHGLLKRRGVACRSQSEAQTRLPLNHHAFDVLTPEAAYWCGFIAADGTIVRRSVSAPELAVVLAARDKNHLLKLRDFLGSGHAITEVPPSNRLYSFSGSTGAARFSIRSQKIADRLESLGVKRGSLDPKLAVSRDFWRGVVDGDGYIGTSVGIARFQVVGRESMLADFSRYLVTTTGSRLSVRPHKSIHAVGTSNKAAERIIRHLYADSVASLDRKNNTALNILAAGLAEGQNGRGATRQPTLAVAADYEAPSHLIAGVSPYAA